MPFHTPGHKQGRGAPSQWLAAVGLSPLQLDVSDVLVSAQYDDSWPLALAAAEQMTAAALDADFCYFLANGTTGGVHAMLLAAASGKSVIISRNSHRSVIGGLILADATPVFVDARYEPSRGVWLPPGPEDWEQALVKHPEVVALLPTYPTYEGVGSDLTGIVAVARKHGAAVLVDEAHGPHFGLHPNLPRRAIDAGADLSAQSPHKLLGSLTQASWLLGREGNVSADAVGIALGILETTSPSALLLASLDIARRQIALEGHALMERALSAAAKMRAYVDEVGYVSNVDFSDVVEREARRTLWDKTKVLVDVSQLGMSGYEAANRLREAGVQVEMGTARHVLALATFGDTEETVAAFCRGMDELVRSAQDAGTMVGDGMAEPDGQSEGRLPPTPPQRLRPREAALGRSERVPLAGAAGRIAADIVCPYPPGIPVLYPGEEVSPEAVAYLQDILHKGGEVRGLTGEPAKPSVRVVAQ